MVIFCVHFLPLQLEFARWYDLIFQLVLFHPISPVPSITIRKKKVSFGPSWCTVSQVSAFPWFGSCAPAEEGEPHYLSRCGWDRLGNGEVNLMEQMLEEGASIWNVWYKYVWQKVCSYSVLLMSNSKSQPLFEFVLLLAALQPATRLQVPLSLAVCSPKSRRSGHDLHRWSAVNDLHPFHAVHAFGNLGCCWFLVRVSR